jgi:cell division protein FtsL
MDNITIGLLCIILYNTIMFVYYSYKLRQLRRENEQLDRTIGDIIGLIRSIMWPNNRE